MHKNTGFQLLYLLLFVGTGLLVFNLFIAAYFFLLGYDLSLIGVQRTSVMHELKSHQMMVLLLSSHIFGLVLPAWFFSVAFDWRGRRINSRNVQWDPLARAFILILCSLPLVGFLAELNAKIQLPSWAVDSESEIRQILKQILDFESPQQLVLAFITIAVVPAIGEEWLFRGILQAKLMEWTPSPWLAILITSVLFSFFHFQFEGFLPRVFLGWVLGFIYFTGKNLWYPILFHFLYNAAQVLAAFLFKDQMMNQLESAQGVSMPGITIFLAAGVFALTSYYSIKSSQ